MGSPYEPARRQGTGPAAPGLLAVLICRGSGVLILESRPWAGTFPGLGLDLSSLDLEEIANALADQTDYEHHWLINPDTREIGLLRCKPQDAIARGYSTGVIGSENSFLIAE